MPIVRQDAWTDQEDRVLAETVLEQIRVGGTQLIAFGLVGKKLERTSAACGFRWNSAIRKLFVKEIEEAKRIRKSNKTKGSKVGAVKSILPRQDVHKKENNVGHVSKGRPRTKDVNLVSLLHNLKKQVDQLERFSRRQVDTRLYEDQIAVLKKQIASLETENAQLKIELDLIEKDYKAFMSVMERARILTLKENPSES